jgi:hypothetical protein
MFSTQYGILGLFLDSMPRDGLDILGEVTLSRSELDLLILLFETRCLIGLSVP